MIQRQVVGDDKVDYSYDAVGNLLVAAMPQTAVNFSYDELNRLSTLNRANGVDTTYEYDLINRLSAITHKQGTTLLDAQRYSYDSNGNRRNFYTDIGQSLITQASTRSYDAGNRLLTLDGISYKYDENGNRISATDAGGTISYIWDARNRLSEITEPNGTNTLFIYDNQNNLLSKEVSNSNGNVVSQDFLVDDLTNVVKMTSSEGQQTSVLTARNIDTHLALTDSSNDQDYLLSDAINSTTATTDENGVIKQQFAYEPFGETTASGQGSLFQYTGRVPVADNLYYYRARFYDPEAGRFISEDPIGFEGGDINLYRYVENNSINNNDPTGNGLIGSAVCVAFQAINAISTINALNELEDELNEITNQINSCTDEANKIELKKKQLKIIQKKTKELAKGGAIGLVGGIICTGLVRL